MQNSVTRVISAAGSIVDVILGVLLLAAVSVTLISVGTSYFNTSLPWVQDVLLLLFVWLIQIGALRTTHIRVRFIVDKLNSPLRRAMSLITAVLSVLALLVLTYGAAVSYKFFANDTYISMPWLSENVRFIPLVVVGPCWIAIIIASELGWIQLDGPASSDEEDSRVEGIV